MLRRLPIESSQPVVVFTLSRLAFALVGLAAMLALALPDDTLAIALVAGIAVPWSLLIIVVSARDAELALSPLVAAGDLVALVAIELAAPETYGGVRFAALFLIAAHAHIQGEWRGLAVSLIGAASIVAATAVRGDAPVSGDVLAFYEVAFITSALATGLVVGRLRTAESTGRLRARRLSRRAIQAENDLRRRLADAIHDGPVQELIGLDMILGSARKAAEEGNAGRAARLLEDARELTERNIRVLRDEIVDLGPHAFQERGFEAAVEHCLPAWRRRYGAEVVVAIERVDLPPDVAGELFRIAQEAVANAGRHADAETVSLSLRAVDSQVELRVSDDGHGFDGSDPLSASEPGHLGLASMRERAELIHGSLELDSSERGTRVLVRAPLPKAQPVR